MAEKIKITFLGTSSAIPTARRNHPAMFLQYKDENILFDCGEGTQRQFRKAKLNPCKITKILISHWHADHVLGLPGLLQTLMFNGYNRKLEIYGPRGTKRKMVPYLDLFVHKGADLNLEVHEVDGGVIFDKGEWRLEAVSLDHDTPANAYAFIVGEKNRLDKKKLAKLKLPNSPLIGELIKGRTIEIGKKKVDGRKLMYKESGRKVVFVMDTRFCEGAVLISKGADVLICEASHSADDGEIALKHAHLTSVDAAKIAKKAKVKKLILMHLSQRYDEIPKKILEEARDFLKGSGINVSVAEDLDELEL